MKASLKYKLTTLPLLAFSAWASANPVLLEISTMDRITAGTQSELAHLENALATARNIVGNFGFADWLPVLDADQQALLVKFASVEPISIHLQSGELVATRQSPSGEQVVFVKQLNAADVASIQRTNPNESVKTYTLSPGESLHLQETGAGGTSYLSVYSTGNSTVTTSLKNDM